MHDARKQEGPARGAFLLGIPAPPLAYFYAGTLAHILSEIDTAKDLVDIVVWQDQSEYSSRVAIVPFAAYVNVGRDAYTAVTNQNMNSNSFNRTCVMERNGVNRYTDAPPSSANGFFARYTGNSTCQPQATVLTAGRARARGR